MRAAARNVTTQPILGAICGSRMRAEMRRLFVRFITNASVRFRNTLWPILIGDASHSNAKFAAKPGT